VALVNRCIASRLVRKRRNSIDARRVEVHVTSRGRRLVARIAARHRTELQSLREVLRMAPTS
jgi:DNA-binding MarR family transcriptional regulator